MYLVDFEEKKKHEYIYVLCKPLICWHLAEIRLVNSIIYGRHQNVYSMSTENCKRIVRYYYMS